MTCTHRSPFGHAVTHEPPCPAKPHRLDGTAHTGIIPRQWQHIVEERDALARENAALRARIATLEAAQHATADAALRRADLVP